jgi:hypothetical protein
VQLALLDSFIAGPEDSTAARGAAAAAAAGLGGAPPTLRAATAAAAGLAGPAGAGAGAAAPAQVSASRLVTARAPASASGSEGAGAAPLPGLDALDVPPGAALSPSSAAAASLARGALSASGAVAVSHAAIDGALADAAPRLVLTALLPNLVWRSGLVAATVRKVAVACVLGLFARELLPLEGLAPILGELLGPLAALTSDDDATTRHMATRALTALFRVAGGALD